jgi:hypothetical protein
MTTLTLPVQLGQYANDGTGDDLRTAFTRVNNSFAALTSSIAVNGGTNLGTGIGIYADKNSTNLEFRTLTSTGNTVTITASTTTVNLEAITHLQSDTNPILGGNLNLNNHHISGGDSQTTVYNVDIKLLNSLIGILIKEDYLIVDMGSFINPIGIKKDSNGNVIGGDTKGYNLDFGGFASSIANLCDFGTFV